MPFRPMLAVGLLLVTQAVAWPLRARACSCLAIAISRSDPAEGASGVPPNQALIVEGHLNPQSFKLVEDASGAQVELDVRHGPQPGCAGTWAELVPKTDLKVMTKYTLRVEPRGAAVGSTPVRNALTFTTGAALLPEQTLLAPKGRVTVVEGAPSDGASCGPTLVQACLGLEDADNVEILARRGDEIIMRWLLPTNEGPIGFSVVPDCLEFRRRSRTGQRSDPLTICGEALGARPYLPSDRGLHLRCHDGVFGSNAPVTTDSADASVIGDAEGGDAQNDKAADDDALEPELRSDGCSTRPVGDAPRSGSLPLLLLVLPMAIRRLRRKPGSRAAGAAHATDG